MRKFKCIRKWARNQVGDIVELYEFKRYPREVRVGHFEEIIAKVAKKVVAPKEVTTTNKFTTKKDTK